MKITLKINDKTTVYSSKSLSSISFQINTLRKTLELNSGGSCIVNYGKGYTNEFDFDNDEDFMTKYKPCIERELVNEFKQDGRVQTRRS